MLPSAQTLFPAEPTTAPAAKPRADTLFPSSQPAAAPKAMPLWNADLIQQHAGPGAITSARRSAAKNAAVGGSKTSSHLTGDAFDFVPKDRNTARAAQALAAAGVPYDQIIDEGDHVHIGWGAKLRNQLKLRGGALPRAAELFSAERRINRRGNEGLAAVKSGSKNLTLHDALGAGGDRGAAAMAALEMLGGGIEMVAAPVSGYAERTFGPAWKALTGGPEAAIGDVSDQLLTLGVPIGPKGVRGVKSKPGAAPVIEVVDEALPLADEMFPGIKAAKARGKAATKPPAEDLFPTSAAAKVEDTVDDILYGPSGRPVLKLKEPRAAKPRGLIPALTEFGQAFQKVAAPATIGNAPEAARTLRRASAEADLATAQTWTRLAASADKVHFLPVEQQRALVRYVEGRSMGAKLADPTLQQAADDIRTTMQGYRQRIEDAFANNLNDADGPSFIRDYYTHMWKEAPEFVEGRMAVTRQGSGRNLKARSIPTLEEGIEAGLTPKFESPIDATMVYASNMSRYLATVDAQADLVARGRAAWHTAASKPEGWVPLDGIGTAKKARTIIKDGEVSAALPERQLYADPNVARVYNNWISRGFEAGDFRRPFEVARRAKNASVALNLFASAWQGTDVTLQSMLSEVARATQSLSRTPGLLAKGDLAGAGRELGQAAKSTVMAPIAPIRGVIEGGKAKQALLRGTTDQMPPIERRATEAYVRAGGRTRMDPINRVQGSASQSFYQAMVDGSLKSELDKAVKGIAGPDKMVSERAASVAQTGMSVIQSLMDPIFSTYIPRLKMDAFKQNMGDWLRRHPEAADDAVDQAAYEIMRSVDNRMGDMAWDNLFWKQQVKQVMNLLYLSPKYTVGMINEYLGGLLDLTGPSAKGLISGEGITPRTAYAVSSLGAMAMVHGVYQYLKTGERPKGMDFVAPRTGGTYTSRSTGTDPERAVFPGYGKDVYTASFDAPNSWPDWLGGKLSSPVKVVGGLAANEDWRGNEIRDPNAPTNKQAWQVLSYVGQQAFAPYWLVDQAKGKRKGSNISTAESFLGVAPAPQSMQDREGALAARKRFRDKAWKRKQRADQQDKAKREP